MTVPASLGPLGAILVLFGAATAAAATAEDVAQACSAGSNLPEAVCACVGEMAADELSDTQRQWYVLAMGGETDAAAALAAQMSPGDTIDAATFLRTSPADCAASN